jgi:hypothetical protein
MLTAFSFANLWYLLQVHPGKTKRDNMLEVFNEMIIYFSQVQMTNLQNSSIPGYTKSTLGWMIILTVCFSIMVNLVLILVESKRAFTENYRVWRMTQKAKSALKERKQNREKLIHAFKGQFKNLEKLQAFEDDIMFVQEWKATRDWLVASGTNVRNMVHYPEEKRFNRICRTHDLHKQAKAVMLLKAVKKAAITNVNAQLKENFVKGQ